MTAKQYLSQALFLKGMIRRADDQISEIRALAESTGAIRYDKLHVQTSPELDPLAAYVAKLEDAEKTALKLRTQYHSTYLMIQEQISEMEPDLFREMLTLRYLDGKPLWRVAKELNYSQTYIRNKHGQALQEFAKRFLTSC